MRFFYLIPSALLFYLFCLNRVSKTETGVSYNIFTQNIELQNSGWNITSPFAMVSYISKTHRELDGTFFLDGILSPKRVSVRVKPGMEREFVKDVGFEYYYGNIIEKSFWIKERPVWLEISER